MEINLVYEEIHYDAQIEVDLHNWTRMIWNVDFSNIIRVVFKEVYKRFRHNEEVLEDESPRLYFDKIEEK